MRVTRLKLVKKISLAVLLSVAMLFFFYSVASANWGPHGGYGSYLGVPADFDLPNLPTAFDPDTDACAGCHRAHTAVSDITWTDSTGAEKNALLISQSATLQDFCFTCHGDVGAGAATNVQSGVYDNSALRVGAGWDATAGYGTSASALDGLLNGGGFDLFNSNAVTSEHGDVGNLAWGGGADGIPNDGPGIPIAGFDCGSCHDPHGSSNYRILKDEVNGVTVGGYDDFTTVDPNPDAYVISNEVNFPIGTAYDASKGFRLHRNYGDKDGDGVTDLLTDYQPDYDDARYARLPDDGDLDPTTEPKGLSGWCAACHTTYNTTSSSGQGEYNADGYDPAYGYGSVVRHRHPVNVALNTFYGDRLLLIDGINDLNTPWGDGVDIPLEHDAYTEGAGTAQLNTDADWMGCLTCHRAHGTDATMSGYANSDSNTYPAYDSDALGNGQGVPPANSSVLLRADNRGVCERCHNK